MVSNGTKVTLIVVALGPDGNDAAIYANKIKLGVENLFITVAPTADSFLPAVGAPAAEFVFSPLQWHDSMKFDDPLFGNSTAYQAEYKKDYGIIPSYTSASGTAAGVALHLAIQASNSLDAPTVMQALRELRADTFFGPMAFNRYQRNYGGSTATVQWLDSKMQAVYPDVSATAASILPRPTFADRARCPTVGSTNLTACLKILNAPQAASADNTVLIAVVVPIAVVIVIIFALFAVKASTAGKNQRNTDHAPRSGRITLMFTDVQDSTKLWSTAPMSMSVALDIHHAVIRACITKHKGYEVKTAGDSFMIACKSEEAAVTLAIDIQRELLFQTYPTAIDAVYAANGDDELLAIEDAPDVTNPPPAPGSSNVWNGLRVRIGFHSGEPQVTFDEVAKGYDYYGPPVNTAARVESVAKGGQVACSQSTLTHLNLDTKEFATRPLGAFELKGVAEPTEIVEIMPTEMVGLRIFNNKPDEDAKDGIDLDGAGDTGSTATFAVEPEVLESVVNTVSTMLRIMRPKEKEATLKEIMKAWRVPWTGGAVIETNVDALARRLAKAYRPAKAPHSTQSSRSSFHVTTTGATNEAAGHRQQQYQKSPLPGSITV